MQLSATQAATHVNPKARALPGMLGALGQALPSYRVCTRAFSAGAAAWRLRMQYGNPRMCVLNSGLVSVQFQGTKWSGKCGG